MDELDALLAEARRLPRSLDQVEVLRRAADLADSLGDLDRAFDARMELVQATYYTEQATLGLSAFAWLVARADAEPERFERHRHVLGWVNKWMPSYARKHAQVPVERLVSLVDDLERRHVAEGSGRRQAVAVRLRLAIDAGIGPDPDELLTDWRASARTSLTDCPMCEVDLEADVLVALGRRDEALRVLDPFFRGEVAVCASGPSSIFRLGVSLLVEEGRIDEARDLFGAVLRAAPASGESRDLSDLAGCAMLLARTGDVVAARRTALSVLPGLRRVGNDHDLMWMVAELARALAPVDGAEELSAPHVSGALDGLDGFDARSFDRWTVAALRDALTHRALELAARFDARNGNEVVSGQIRDALSGPDLPTVSLRGTEPGAPDAEEPATIGAAGDPAIDPTADLVLEPVTEPTRPAPEPTDGPLAFDRWVREQFEAWRAHASREVVRDRYLAAGDDPVLAAVTLSWLLGTDDVADLDRAHELVVDDQLPNDLRARLCAVLARAHLDAGDPDGVPELIDRARGLVEAGGTGAGGMEPVAGMRCLRNLAEAALALGDVEGAEQVLATSAALDLTDPMAGFLLDAARLTVANARWAAANPEGAETGPDDSTPAGAAPEGRAVAVAATDVLESAGDVVGGSGGGVANPLVVISVLDATSTLMEVADAAPPHEPLERVLEGVPIQVDTAPLRAQAYLVLADLHLRLDGPAAAMGRQRRAIEAVERVGPPGLVGWARRGLALQLQHLGRHDEALVQFAMSVDLLRAGDDIVNAWMVEAARARCLLDAGDPDRAANVADDVIAEIDEADGLPDDLRDHVVEPALDVAIDAEVQAGGDKRAARLLERFAELQERLGRPSVPAWSMGAMCAARSGNVEQAEQLFDRGERSVRRGPGPEHDIDLAVLRSRRAEVLWQLDRNLEAVAAADDAVALARRAGDPRLAAVTLSVAARAAHDELLLLLDADDPRAGAQGDQAVDALVAAIQDAEVVGLDDLAAHLGERLDDARRRLDDRLDGRGD